MATDYTRQWIQFFTGCGIPSDVAATYGLIFNENRIQKNMLLDLNKEYLRDMGITVMGDVIAILRHAKIAHEKYVREQILSESEGKASPKMYNLLRESSPAPKKSSPVQRILEHYTGKYDRTELDDVDEEVRIRIENEKSLVSVPKKLAHRIGVPSKLRAKKKIEAPPPRVENLKAEVSLPKPKSLRVPPESEGMYKIKMPSGTTERSKKLLEKAAKLTQSKTVFDRLGESSVSSSSDVTPTAGNASNPRATSSVFSRLGEKSALVTSTSSNGDPHDQLPYRGILKTSSARKKLSSRHSPNATGTMRADDELVKSGPKVKKIDLVKERLGPGSKARSPDIQAKRNTLRITTSFEEDSGREESQMETLSKRFRSMKTAAADSALDQKDILDGLSSFRSEGMRSKGAVSSSTTRLSHARQRGLKRGVQDVAEGTSEISGSAPSKKVRFGKTTERLIPASTEQRSGAAVTTTTLACVCENGSEESALRPGIRIGVMNSDRMRRKPSMKERIGRGSLRGGRTATDIHRKPSLSFVGRARKELINVRDRLG